MGEITESGKRTKFEHLVVDTSVFIKNVQLQNIAENCYTVRGVIREIKHDRQMKALAVLPYNLKVLLPDPDALAKVIAFAKKTGDFASLSLVDLEVIALTYELEARYVGEGHLRTEPKPAVTLTNPNESPDELGTADIAGFYKPKQAADPDQPDNEESQVEEPRHDDSAADYVSAVKVPKSDGHHEENGEEHGDEHEEEEHGEELGGDSSDEEDYDGDDNVDDDDEGWVTPANIAQVKRGYGMNYLEEVPSSVACITTDYAIQNVLKQLGLQLATMDGRVITQTRTYILRCYACFKTTPDATKVFCPRCGNQTLKKVAVSLDANGQQVIHINSRRPLTAKYKNRPVAKFDGGKYATNPLLYEDQPLPQQRISAKARSKTNALAEDYTAGYSPFVMRDVDSRSAVLRGSTNLKQRMRNFEYDNKRRGYKK
ncbi:RNA-binding protein NOB1-like [Anopheles ziemanni]|uniref:RNA-binding protein NOB1-like n=1 Tax=Anopheles coustani TaxID=139045 RepID=UPI00265A2117|nr:RNA-binding protein NOB1-like [Anopheles coustani]XP_058175896.1 RNA-binding protein NOB1-like [Anopheles ziemanni]